MLGNVEPGSECLGVWWISRRCPRACALLGFKRLIQQPEAIDVEVIFQSPAAALLPHPDNVQVWRVLNLMYPV